jgi:RNA polymerase sigma-70 factor (ECF subfamily)
LRAIAVSCVAEAVDEDASDLALLALGDRSALARLYDRHAGHVFALALRWSSDRATAEELVHEVFLELWHRRVHEAGTLRAWLVARTLRLRRRS